MHDPVLELTHDHGEINRLVLDLAGALRRSAHATTVSEQVQVTLGELQDMLFTHFAREEEALFPFIAEAIPALASEIDTLLFAHDSLCGLVARLVHLASSPMGATMLVPLFERFETAYTAHSRAESSFLGSLNTRLDQPQRKRLGALVAAV